MNSLTCYFRKHHVIFIGVMAIFMLIPSLGKASILDEYPTLYATLNGDFSSNLCPGFGIVENDGDVSELNRMTMLESQNSYSAFGITRNSSGDYWTSTGNALVQFNESTGNIIQSLERVNEPFLHIVFDPFDRIYGWSNSNGFLYEIQFADNSYTEIPLFYVGLSGGGLTEMAFTEDGTLYGVDNRFKRLITIDLISGAVTTVVNLPAGSYVGLAVTPDGTLLVSDTISRSLVEFDRQGGEISRMTYTSSNPIMGLEFASLLAVQDIFIDIKPGSDQNCFNVDGHGVIPVAILGSENFDVSQINLTSLSFGGLEVRIRGNREALCSIEYSNEDAYQDLVCHFEDDSSTWSAGDGEATLTGELLDGTHFSGIDSICAVP